MKVSINSKHNAILDYVYVPTYSYNSYQLQIIPTNTISDHKLLYLEATVYPTRRTNNPSHFIIYPKWKFLIKNKNDQNHHNYHLMIQQIHHSWYQFSQSQPIDNASINHVTRIFKVAYSIIWQSAYDNDMCVAIPLSHKTYNQRCRNDYYINDEIHQLLDSEIALINQQDLLFNQLDINNSILHNSVIQYQIEKLSSEIIKTRQLIRQKQIDAINSKLNEMYDKNDHRKISKFYKLLKGDSTFDFYGIEMENDFVTLDKIQILEQIQELFGKLFHDPNYSDKIDVGTLREYAKKAWNQIKKNQCKFIPNDDQIDQMFNDYNMNGTTTQLGIKLELWYDLWVHRKSNNIVRDLIKLIFITGMYSEMDTIATTTAMPKKINANSAKKFSPITLQSEIPKMCYKISLNVSKEILFTHIDQSQSGAQRLISHQDQLGTIIITNKQQLSIELPVILALGDTEKAFDSILHRDVSKALWNECKLKGNLFLLIANAYLTANTFMKVSLAGLMIHGARLEMCNGIFQGNSQSATLYVLVTDLVVKQFRSKIKDLPKIKSLIPQTNNWKKYFDSQSIHDDIMVQILIILFIFVDDTSLIANDIKSIKIMFEKYIGDSHEHNLHINNEKTKLIIFNRKFLSKHDKQWLNDNSNRMKINGIMVQHKDPRSG